jgi:hypothetical protein
MTQFECPYLNAEVELSAEREAHIADRHPDLLPAHRDRIAEVLTHPDQVLRSARFGGARLFLRWYNDGPRGKHVVVVVVSESGAVERHWIITAYHARRLPEGEVEWSGA